MAEKNPQEIRDTLLRELRSRSRQVCDVSYRYIDAIIKETSSRSRRWM